MAREDPQLKLRLNIELKEKVVDAARQNGRSVNAEIVSRLSGSFDLTSEEQARNDVFREELKSIIQESVDFDEAARTLYVALDANGLPLSWPEVMKHLSEIDRAGYFNIKKIEGMVFDGTVPSNGDRQEEIVKLYKEYRKLRRMSKNRMDDD